jgi:CopG family nickel-responsive transcriptional regulator
MTLEPELLTEFDRYCRQGWFATRSEAMRQILREKLTASTWELDAGEAVATLTLVYDHHRTHLAEKLIEIQHDHSERIISSLHVHLDHDTCLEVIVLRGKGKELEHLASALRGLKGIHSANLVLAGTLSHHS